MKKRASSFDFLGDGMTALCGGALAFNLLLVLALLVVLGMNGMGFFWQGSLEHVRLEDGTRLLGELRGREEIPGTADGAAGAATRQ